MRRTRSHLNALRRRLRLLLEFWSISIAVHDNCVCRTLVCQPVWYCEGHVGSGETGRVAVLQRHSRKFQWKFQWKFQRKFQRKFQWEISMRNLSENFHKIFTEVFHVNFTAWLFWGHQKVHKQFHQFLAKTGVQMKNLMSVFLYRAQIFYKPHLNPDHCIGFLLITPQWHLFISQFKM